MRQDFKDEEYFERYKVETLYLIDRSLKWVVEGVIPKENIAMTQRLIASNYLKYFISCYTSQDTNSSIKSLFVNAVEYTNKSWDGFWKLKDRDGNECDQYILSAYDEMLWMLSLGYLLEVSDDTFKKLVEVIDRDKVKDFLYEFIISAKLKDRQSIKEESYSDFKGIPESFVKLREAISQTDKTNAEKLVKEFITKNWYKNHKDAGWYNSHKSKFDIYYGYWSFETAAVVKIMGLDDSSFSDCKYYPKDLV